tara:strand:+ start:584 stop:1306 length:723 start_codon:yes stop_codon:yes gene_type:complete
MSRKIKFWTSSIYLKEKQDFPKPIKTNIPDWFKKLQHQPEKQTVKGCIPFLETLTTGYVLNLPQDFHLQHNVFVNNEKVSKLHPSLMQKRNTNLNIKNEEECHPTGQFKDSPLEKKNLNLSAHKILNPWVIKTPPGYSCLFVPPLNNSDDRFSIISGIVNTDIFAQEINFPFIVNGDKYPVLDTVLQKGIPYVQVIPFKRDSWEMEIGEIPKEDRVNLWSWTLNKLHVYKKKVWDKQSWI